MNSNSRVVPDSLLKMLRALLPSAIKLLDTWSCLVRAVFSGGLRHERSGSWGSARTAADLNRAGAKRAKTAQAIA